MADVCRLPYLTCYPRTHAGLQPQLLPGPAVAAYLGALQLSNSSTPPNNYGAAQGRPELRLRDGRLVALCDRGFDDAAATSACRYVTASGMYGWPYGVSIRGSYFGSTAGAAAWIADLRCPAGDEANIGACLGTVYNSSAEAAAAGCDNTTNAGVRCFAQDCESWACTGIDVLSRKSFRTILLVLASQATSGGIALRALDLSFPTLEIPSILPHLSALAATDLTPPGSPPLPLRLVSSGNQTALDAAARAGLVAAGRLEVQWGGVWGGVCSSPGSTFSNWWRDTHAQVVCRQLGYPDGHAFVVGTNTSSLLPDPPPADQPQFITYVQCNGSEPGLGACRGLPINGTYSSCGPANAVSVACYSQPREFPCIASAPATTL